MSRTSVIPRRITATRLFDLGACNSELAMFRATFNDGAALTKTNILRAAKAGLHLQWLAHRLPLRAAARRQFNRAVEAAYTVFSDATRAPWSAYTSSPTPAHTEAIAKARAEAGMVLGETIAAALWDAIVATRKKAVK